MTRSTGMVPELGLGSASEPIARWGESAPKSLLGAAATGMFPPPPPYPPPHAARPSKEDSITEAARSLRARIVRLLSVTIRSTATRAGHMVNSTSSRTLPARADGKVYPNVLRVRAWPRRAFYKPECRSAPRPQIGLACIRIGLRLDRFRPLGDAHRRPPSPEARAPVPSDLLHVVVELDRVAGRVEHVGVVVDPRRERARDFDELAAASFQEIDRGAQLLVGRDLRAEAHHGGMRGEPELLPERNRIERERVVLGAAAEEHAVVALPADRLGAREAHDVAVEGLHLFHVAAEEADRA